MSTSNQTPRLVRVRRESIVSQGEQHLLDQFGDLWFDLGVHNSSMHLHSCRPITCGEDGPVYLWFDHELDMHQPTEE